MGLAPVTGEMCLRAWATEMVLVTNLMSGNIWAWSMESRWICKAPGQNCVVWSSSKSQVPFWEKKNGGGGWWRRRNRLLGFTTAWSCSPVRWLSRSGHGFLGTYKLPQDSLVSLFSCEGIRLSLFRVCLIATIEKCNILTARLKIEWGFVATYLLWLCLKKTKI